MKSFKLSLICLFFSIFFFNIYASKAMEEGELLFSHDFKHPSHEVFLFDDKIWLVENDGLRSKGEKPSRNIYLNIPELKNFSLRIRVKLLGADMDDRSYNQYHFGLFFDYKNGKTLQAYTWRNRFACLGTENGKEIFHKIIASYKDDIKIGKTSEWIEFEFIFKNRNVDILKDGQFIGDIEFTDEAVSRVKIYAWNCDIKVNDIELRKLTIPRQTQKPVSTDTKPVFYASFDDAPGAENLQNSWKYNAVSSENITYIDGIKGKALNLDSDKKSFLKYNSENIFKSEGGTLMFWFKPAWDGGPKKHILFSALDINGNTVFSLFWDHFLQCFLRVNEYHQIKMLRYCYRHIFKNDWIHIAVTWNRNGWNTLYLNGIKYQHGQFPGPIFPVAGNVDIKNSSYFLVGSTNIYSSVSGNADGAVDELKIFNTPLDDNAVISEYRKYFPIEFMLDKRFIESGKETELDLILISHLSEILEIRSSLLSSNSDIPIIKKTEKLSPGRNKINLKIKGIPPGTYQLKCSFNYNGSERFRTFNVFAYEQNLPAKVEDMKAEENAFLDFNLLSMNKDKIYSEGKIQEKDETQLKYIQAGKNKGDRFSFEIKFPEDIIANKLPVIIDIYWPDNQPRSAGFYMYAKSRSKQHRDRLEGGIQSGMEFPPLSGKMQKTSYLFYPGISEYLFEARTMVPGMPAAVSRVCIRRITEQLPPLKINLPPEFQSRGLGHMDEDQSFEFVMNRDDRDEISSPSYPVKVFQRLCNYFAYTGQNTIAYPVLRYNYVYYDLPGQYDSIDIRYSGWIMLLLDILKSYGMNFIATVNLATLPEFWLPQDEIGNMKKNGMIMFDKNGKTISGGLASAVANPVHPDVRKCFLKHIAEILDRFGRHPAFKGLDIWIDTAWTFTSLDQGYDDYTVDLFSQETGIKIPSFDEGGRFQKRYNLLTSKYRKEWLKWRSEKSMEQISEIQALIHKYNQGLKFYLNFSKLNPEEFHNLDSIDDFSFKKFYYETYGVDMDKVKTDTSAIMVPNRNATRYRWFLHWDDTPTISEELSYTPGIYSSFLRNGTTSTWTLNTYFETWNNSLLPDQYASYFQNSDVKPHGRHFLKEFAFNMAAFDSDMMLMGGQPLGSLGREDLMREFAKAYRALPAHPFNDIKGTGGDFVKGRFLNSDNGAYIYFVNISWSKVNIILDTKEDISLVDLSDMHRVSSQKGKLTLSLDPYQLRSFRSDRKNILFNEYVILPAPELESFYKNKVSELLEIRKLLSETNCSEQAFCIKLKNFIEAVNEKNYFAAHELLFSKSISGIVKKYSSVDRKILSLQKEMIAKGHYAVNCGSNEFLLMKDGRLFFPDKLFTPNSYGYSGTYEKVIRNTEGISDKVNAELFITEAYNIDSYHFTVPNGSYTVKLYLKIGFMQNAKPGVFVMDINIEGQDKAKNLDIFEKCMNDPNNVFIKEFTNIEVKDRILDISFLTNGNPTARMCNAIEIIPQ